MCMLGKPPVWLWWWRGNPTRISFGLRYFVQDGTTFSLRLGLINWSSPFFTSLLQDDVLLSESSHFTFVYDDPEYSLVILSVKREHSGVYTCTAKNVAGSVSCKAELTVLTGLIPTVELIKY